MYDIQELKQPLKIYTPLLINLEQRKIVIFMKKVNDISAIFFLFVHFKFVHFKREKFKLDF